MAIPTSAFDLQGSAPSSASAITAQNIAKLKGEQQALQTNNNSARFNTPANTKQPLASNPFGLISGGLQGIKQGINAPNQREADKLKADAAANYQASRDTVGDQLNTAKLDQALQIANDQNANATERNTANNLADQLLQQQRDASALERKQLEINNKPRSTTTHTDRSGKTELIDSKTGEPIKTIEPAIDIPTEIRANEDGTSTVINTDTGYDVNWKKGQVELATSANKIYNVADSSIKAVDLITDEDVVNAGGATSLGGAITPSSRASVAKVNQLLSKEFTANVADLKGLGSLSNAEGSKITSAQTALVDPETGELKTGLDEAFIKDQLSILKVGAENSQLIAQYIQKEGREPTIKEYEEFKIADPTPTTNRSISGSSRSATESEASTATPSTGTSANFTDVEYQTTPSGVRYRVGG
ncbi:hypothetical protein [Psychromonas sp. Urea-02u-13]|uniref:hypothetical protein n=1 Tax=Psychromonas sp. Urea-02u-13 TaxID=2058326 RepID=UPI000C329094|nr:hypothetical protein [Psychromonas sp. Urea-02u-13]PKG37723.1 hypothetical protein CXF74_17465 [Psychromonas sp. Urea-02u-13]